MSAASRLSFEADISLRIGKRSGTNIPKISKTGSGFESLPDSYPGQEPSFGYYDSDLYRGGGVVKSAGDENTSPCQSLRSFALSLYTYFR